MMMMMMMMMMTMMMMMMMEQSGTYASTRHSTLDVVVESRRGKRESHRHRIHRRRGRWRACA